MNRFPSYLCVATAIVAVGSVAARAQSPPEREGTSSILLDNGHLLRGQIVDEGEQVLLRLGPGSQLRLPRPRIRAVASSPRELFQVQHQQLHPRDVPGRIALARWCMRYNLRADAGQVITELIALAPRDPQVAALEQQLRQSLAKAPATPSEDSQPSPQTNTARQIGLVDVSRVETLTGEQLAAFAQHVQPILLNHCSAAGCHGVLAKSEFQLLRPLKGQRLTQRMTSQNLASAMKFVDTAQPLESPLLLAASTPHADRASPILDEPLMTPTRELLADWLLSMQEVQGETDAAVPPAEAPSPLTQRQAREPGATEAGSFRESDADSSLPSVGPISEAQLIDPFDPSAFNHRYFPDRMQPRSPFDAADEDQSPSSVNDPDSSAARNAELLESKPGNSANAAGESH